MPVHWVLAEVHLAVELHLVCHDHGPIADYSIFEHHEAVGSGGKECFGKGSG